MDNEFIRFIKTDTNNHPNIYFDDKGNETGFFCDFERVKESQFQKGIKDERKQIPRKRIKSYIELMDWIEYLITVVRIRENIDKDDGDDEYKDSSSDDDDDDDNNKQQQHSNDDPRRSTRRRRMRKRDEEHEKYMEKLDEDIERGKREKEKRRFERDMIEAVSESLKEESDINSFILKDGNSKKYETYQTKMDKEIEKGVEKNKRTKQFNVDLEKAKKLSLESLPPFGKNYIKGTNFKNYDTKRAQIESLKEHKIDMEMKKMQREHREREKKQKQKQKQKQRLLQIKEGEDDNNYDNIYEIEGEEELEWDDDKMDEMD